MQAVDGNAIAGDLFEIFGTDMTTARGACAHCGATMPIVVKGYSCVLIFSDAVAMMLKNYESHLINRVEDWQFLPQGLKPSILSSLYGTAEAVPFQNYLFKIASK